MSYSIIITASYISSHPSIEFIKYTIQSLKYINMTQKIPIILAHDYSNNPNYIEYIQNLREYISDKPNIKIVIRDSHGHLTGNIRNALTYIDTDYVLIIQHDLPFTRYFDINKVIEDIKQNPEMKHIRFNYRTNIKTKYDSINDLFGKQLKSVHYTYTRTPGWCDQNHLCNTNYYRDIILKECDDGNFMENYLSNKSTTEEIHTKYGTYIFGELNALACINHLNGSSK